MKNFGFLPKICTHLPNNASKLGVAYHSLLTKKVYKCPLMNGTTQISDFLPNFRTKTALTFRTSQSVVTHVCANKCFPHHPAVQTVYINSLIVMYIDAHFSIKFNLLQVYTPKQLPYSFPDKIYTSHESCMWH